jgi:hypothetical protein
MPSRRRLQYMVLRRHGYSVYWGVGGVRRYTALAAAAIVLAASGPAVAAEPVASPDITTYLAVAQQYWHAPPPCPIVIVRDELRPDSAVWAATLTDRCLIALDPDFYPRPLGLDVWYWQAEMCSVITHEYGHLLGYSHTTDPMSVMNPLTPLNVVPGCPRWAPDKVLYIRRQARRALSAVRRRAHRRHVLMRERHHVGTGTLR